MPLFLHPDVVLRPGAALPELSRNGGGVVHQLSGLEAAALSLLAHFGDAEAAAAYLNACLGQGRGTELLALVRARWATYLGDGPARELDLAWLSRFVHALPTLNRIRAREAAPRAISWLVTLCCNRQCPYCYYDVLPWHSSCSAPEDATFPHRDVVRLLDDMALHGVADLYLTGGEPLLRPDLPDIIAQASFRGIGTHMSTKFAIGRALARELSHARLGDVCFSFDSAIPREADRLAGCKGFVIQAMEAIETMLNVGLNVRVNTVVTAVNAGRIHKLLELCASIGLREITLSPFIMPPQYDRAFAGLPSRSTELTPLVKRLRAEYAGRMAVKLGSAEAFRSEQRVDCSDWLLCEVGIQSLDLLPDGRATRCRYAPYDEALVVGDLRKQTLIEVWQGASLNRLIEPERDEFAETACGTCPGHSACNARGRCVLGAMTVHGRYHAPDAGCTRIEA